MIADFQGVGAYLFHCDDRRSAFDRRRRAGCAQHRLLPLPQFAHRLLSDGRARYAPRAGKADVQRLRLHRRLAPVRCRLLRQGAQRHASLSLSIRETVHEEPDAGLLQGDGVTVRIVGAGRYVLYSEGGSRSAGSDRGVSGAYRRAPRRRGADATKFPRPLGRSGGAARIACGACPRARPARSSSALCNSMGDYDLYDVLGAAAYGLDPKSRRGRAEAFGYKAQQLARFAAARRLGCFARGGRSIWRRGAPRPWRIRRSFNCRPSSPPEAIAAFRAAGDPRGMVTDAKRRVFEA